MYGTIFNLKVKEGHERDLLEIMGERNTGIKGAVAWFLPETRSSFCLSWGLSQIPLYQNSGWGIGAELSM